MTSALPRIGLSSCFFHPDPKRNIFKGRTLLYVEESMAHFFMAAGILPILIPSAGGGLDIPDLAAQVDGLVLTGGSDVSPRSYGEEALREEWAGDYIRDQYEIALMQACIERDVPVLGICRGAQLMNVALGGSLYQDISTQRPDAIVHRDHAVYDKLVHEIAIEPDSGLARLYPGVTRATVNSVHHQAIKDLAGNLAVEAWCTSDEVIEAVRYVGNGRYAFGVQWHPEFMTLGDVHLLPPRPILDDFLAAVRTRAR